jgi:hypothetical protein
MLLQIDVPVHTTCLKKQQSRGLRLHWAGGASKDPPRTEQWLSHQTPGTTRPCFLRTVLFTDTKKGTHDVQNLYF